MTPFCLCLTSGRAGAPARRHHLSERRAVLRCTWRSEKLRGRPRPTLLGLAAKDSINVPIVEVLFLSVRLVDWHHRAHDSSVRSPSLLPALLVALLLVALLLVALLLFALLLFALLLSSLDLVLVL